MLNTFNRLLEVADGLQTDFMKLLYYEFDGNYHDNYKSYDSIRLCTILEGEKHVSINNEDKFTYDKNKLLLLPSHSSVHMDIENHTKALVLELNDKLISEVKNNTYGNESSEIDENRFFIGSNDGDVNNCLTRINNIAISKDRDKEYLLDILARELTTYVVRSSGARQILSHQANTLSSQAIKLMKENIKPPISLNYIAFRLNVSVAQLSSKFKKEIGVTPSVFYNNLKMQEAKTLLRHKNVNETAWTLGFENVSHFIRLFKKAYGYSPAEWKNK